MGAAWTNLLTKVGTGEEGTPSRGAVVPEEPGESSFMTSSSSVGDGAMTGAGTGEVEATMVAI